MRCLNVFGNQDRETFKYRNTGKSPVGSHEKIDTALRSPPDRGGKLQGVERPKPILLRMASQQFLGLVIIFLHYSMRDELPGFVALGDSTERICRRLPR